MNSYKYFENRDCKFYPCHNSEHINCMFCVCPFFDEPNCGGNFKILSNGVKDCSDCLYPHLEGSYEDIMKRLAERCKRNGKVQKDM